MLVLGATNYSASLAGADVISLSLARHIALVTSSPLLPPIASHLFKWREPCRADAEAAGRVAGAM